MLVYLFFDSLLSTYRKNMETAKPLSKIEFQSKLSLSKVAIEYILIDYIAMFVYLKLRYIFKPVSEMTKIGHLLKI